MSKPSAEELEFIGHLKWLLEKSEDGRGAMANLRRGLGKPPGTVYQMDRYVLPKLPKDAAQRQEDAYYLVGALFAYWHQSKEKADSTGGNMGKSLRALVEQQVAAGSDRDNAEKAIEKRLNALLNAHRDDLTEHLRRIVALLKSKDVSVNWAQLLHDISGWDWDNRTVQHVWARGFWVQQRKEAMDQKQEKLTKGD